MPRKLPPSSRSDELARQLEAKARELTEMPIAKDPSDIQDTDAVFALLKELCPEFIGQALEENRLKDLMRLTEYLREKLNTCAQAAHWLQNSDSKIQELELAKSSLQDLIRRVGMNIDSEQMKNFEGKPGELIECHLPPVVAHELYWAAYPLIVNQGLRELKGEKNELPIPPTDLNHDRFFGRVEGHTPGDLLVVQGDGSLKKLTRVPDPRKEPVFPVTPGKSVTDLVRQMDIAVRQEVVRQGHVVERLSLHPSQDSKTIGVDLQLVDKTKPFDNKAMRDVIDRQLSSTDRNASPRDILQMAQALYKDGHISTKGLMNAAGIDEADDMGKLMAASFTKEMKQIEKKNAQAIDVQEAKDKGTVMREALEKAKAPPFLDDFKFPQGVKY